MENIETYLKQLIEEYKPLATLTEDEQKAIKLGGVKNFIVNKITSNKYKGSAFPQELQEKVEKNVSDAIVVSRPIHFTIPFGGFKNWRLPSYSKLDWADVFNIIQMRNLAIEIAKAYEPGVIIQYFSDEIFVSRMNNMPQEDLDRYNNLFNLAVAYVQQFTPSNVMLRYSKIRDEISQKEILRRFDEAMGEFRKDWEKLPTEEQDIKLEKTRRNFRLVDEGLSEIEIRNQLVESFLVHEVFVTIDWDDDIPWAFRPDMIPVGFRYTKKWGIHLKSSPSSTVQFWVGFGALEKRKDKYIPAILTYNQYLDKKAQLVYEKVGVLPEMFGLGEIPYFSA